MRASTILHAQKLLTTDVSYPLALQQAIRGALREPTPQVKASTSDLFLCWLIDAARFFGSRVGMLGRS